MSEERLLQDGQRQTGAVALHDLSNKKHLVNISKNIIISCDHHISIICINDVSDKLYHGHQGGWQHRMDQSP